jgi:hypothetical protein
MNKNSKNIKKISSPSPKKEQQKAKTCTEKKNKIHLGPCDTQYFQACSGTACVNA